MSPEEAIISNQAIGGEISIMVVVKWSDKVEGSGDNIYAPLCGVLYKEKGNYIFPWSGIDPYAKINCFN